MNELIEFIKIGGPVAVVLAISTYGMIRTINTFVAFLTGASQRHEEAIRVMTVENRAAVKHMADENRGAMDHIWKESRETGVATQAALTDVSKELHSLATAVEKNTLATKELAKVNHANNHK